MNLGINLGWPFRPADWSSSVRMLANSSAWSKFVWILSNSDEYGPTSPWCMFANQGAGTDSLTDAGYEPWQWTVAVSRQLVALWLCWLPDAKNPLRIVCPRFDVQQRNVSTVREERRFNPRFNSSEVGRWEERISPTPWMMAGCLTFQFALNLNALSSHLASQCPSLASGLFYSDNGKFNNGALALRSWAREAICLVTFESVRLTFADEQILWESRWCTWRLPAREFPQSLGRLLWCGRCCEDIHSDSSNMFCVN